VLVKGSQTADSFTFSAQLSVHSECALLAALHERESAAVGYIGVSKLLCAHCFEYFAVYRDVTGRSFTTLGMHGGEQGLWVYQPLPDSANEAVHAILTHKAFSDTFHKISQPSQDTATFSADKARRLALAAGAREYVLLLDVTTRLAESVQRILRICNYRGGNA
jgi:hypothetical protein